MTAPPEESELSRLLDDLRGQESAHGDREFELLYSKLYGIARGIAPGATLGPTALVNEAYVRLARRTDEPNDRAHFVRLVARAMRHTVIDYYRAKDRRPGTLEESAEVPEPRLDGDTDPLDPLAVEEALDRLERLAPDQVRIAELRLFAGYSTRDAAEVLDISTATAERRWRAAKAFLKMRLDGGEPE